MKQPPTRAQQILRYIARAKKGATFEQVAAHIERNVAGDVNRNAINAQVCQLVNSGKLTRTGTPRAYRYTATATALIDGRRRQKPVQPAVPAPKAKPPVARPNTAASPATTRSAAAGQTLYGLSPPKTIATPSQSTETVDEFVARGGRIQYLKPGESSGVLARLEEQYATKARGRPAATTQRSAADDAG